MNQNKDLAKATLRGTFWEYSSKYSAKFLLFISTVILARLLLQEEFGIAGYALVVIGFLEVMEGLGIAHAVVYHHEERDRLDTAFWLGLGFGVVLFGLAWFLVAPLAGLFFNDARAVPVTRALALTFPISALSLVHSALLAKKLAFGRKFIPEMARAVSKGSIAIALAWMGFGAWSLIIGQLAGAIVMTIGYWLVSPWRPRLHFQRRLATPLISYGTGVVTINGLAILMLNADYLLIGRYLGAAALGTYTLAFRVPELLVKQFCNVVSTVTFPVYTQMRNDPQALRRGFLLTMRYVTMLTIPMGLGLALVSRPFVLTVFTAKWAEAIPVMAAIALYTLLRSLVFNAGSVYKATGHPGLLSKLSLVQTMVTVPLLWWVVVYQQTILAVAWAQVALALVFGLVKLVLAGRLIDIRLRDLLQVFYPSLAAGAIMTMAVLLAAHFLAGASSLIELIIEVLLGGLVYGAVLWLIQREDVVRGVALLRTAFRPKASGLATVAPSPADGAQLPAATLE